MISQRNIVLLSFPFSDLRTEKVRPAVVISNDEYNKKFEDLIAVPLTTNLRLRDYTILLTNKELERGKLIKTSKIKVDRVFSVDKSLIRMIIGKVSKRVHSKIVEILTELIR